MRFADAGWPEQQNVASPIDPAIRCSDPDQIENGDVERKCQTFGCRISYKCRAGYELDGRQHRYCQADGSWSPRLLPECVRK